MGPYEHDHFHGYKFCTKTLCTPIPRSKPVTTPQSEGLIHEIPSISYLKKDDRVRFVSGKPKNEVLYATATMDGHGVSEHYGTRQGNHFYEDPQKNYINVRFDHVNYGEGWRHPNDGVYEKDGWRIFVNAETAARVKRDIEVNQNLGVKRELELKLGEAETELRSRLAAVESQRRHVNQLKSKLGELEKPAVDVNDWHIDVHVPGKKWHIVTPDGERLLYAHLETAERELAEYKSGVRTLI